MYSKFKQFYTRNVFENVVCMRTRSIHVLLRLMPWRSNELARPSADMVISMLADDKWVLVFREESLQMPIPFHWKKNQIRVYWKKSLYKKSYKSTCLPTKLFSIIFSCFPSMNIRCTHEPPVQIVARILASWMQQGQNARTHVSRKPIAQLTAQSLCLWEEWRHIATMASFYNLRFTFIFTFHVCLHVLHGQLSTKR